MPPTDPFLVRHDSPLGPLRIRVLPGRAAEVSGGGDDGFLALDGKEFALLARYHRRGRGWQVQAIRVVPGPGGSPGHVAVAAALGRFLPAVLDASARLFVERDVLQVRYERRIEEEAMRRVRDEIERRRAKLRAMARAARDAAPARDARERLLLDELAAFPDPVPGRGFPAAG